MRSIFISLLFLCPFLCFSQLEIKGKVISKTETIAFANVILSTPGSDGTVITGAITDENGNFTLMAKEGTYTLAIRFMGYTEWKKGIVLDSVVDLGNITLDSSTTSLDEVVITKTKKVIERKPDRLIFNVENSIAASGGDAMDALKVAPGIAIQNNSITMIGRGQSRVMIDGRLLQLSGEELVDFLASIAADDIKKIEIITNPPAQYEAAGNGGLINILYKRGARNSWKNNTSLAYNQNKYQFTTLRNNFFYNKNRLRFSLSTNGTLGNKREDEEIDVLYLDRQWLSDADGKARRDNISGRLSIDYDITDKTTIGAQYLGNYSTPDYDILATTQIFNATSQIDSILINNSFSGRNVNSHLYNAHITTILDTLDRKVSLDLDYFDYDNELKQNDLVNSFSPNNDFLGINLQSENLGNQRIDNVSLKVDVEHPFSNININYGGKISFIKTINNLQNFTIQTAAPLFNPNSSNEFEYTENIQAAYVNGSKKIGDHWEFQAGLRLENTNTEGFSKTLNQKNTNQYLKLFPTAYISYQKNDNHTFSFNYGKRINRPSFRNLNPFRIYINSNAFSEGNPFLQPSFTDNFEFNHTYKGKLTTNAFFNIRSDGFGTIFSADEETEVQSIIRANYYTNYNWGVGEIYSFDTFSWWKSQNQVYLFGSKTVIDDNVIAVPQNGIQLYLATNNTFSLGKNTKLQANFWYRSPGKFVLFDISESYSFDLAIKQSMFKDKVQLSLAVNDIFDKANDGKLISIVNDVKTAYAQNYSTRFARISISYSFGNSKIKNEQRNFGNDEERNRSN
ncbi:outer membrane receptor protein involved in Fe transport [Aquimarina sp. MAR_2010_214]|uniref:TonB-dependent receptor domain-containing protein n=1 Tax=Aquimarina sp. MAR_2010_214 TaxID=1250026 RepID=UPI000C703CC4|nr:TonB-dependent receptor [Aquimarina sp. MAR_2010_214]PKV51449.1 outer membrane receptor protein involved in Fe transport [Aquimarina sp. MAR_2010_214]